MSVDAERKYLAEIVETVSSATGQNVKGWLGPALSETFETPRFAAGPWTDLHPRLERR